MLETGSNLRVANADLEFVTLLPWQCWDFRCHSLAETDFDREELGYLGWGGQQGLCSWGDGIRVWERCVRAQS